MAISISGTVYTDQGVTTMGSGRTVAVSVNGAAAAGTTTTAANGTFTLAGITAASGAVLTLYLQGNTEVGCTVTKSTNATMTGIDIWQDTLKLRSDNGAALTGTNLNTSDNNGATGITSIYAAASNTALTVASGKGLVVDTSQSFTPGGAAAISVTSADLTINGTMTLSGGSFTVNTSGNVVVNGTLSATTSGSGTVASGNVTVNGTATTSGWQLIITSGNLVINGTASKTATWTITSGNVTVNIGGSFTVTGTTSISNGNLVNAGTLGGAGGFSITGNVTNSGTCTITGSMTLSGTGSQTLDMGGSTTLLATVTISANANYTLSSSFVCKSLSISSGATLDVSASNYGITLGPGNGSFTFNNAGTFNARAGTVTLNAGGGFTQNFTGSPTFYNLVISATTVGTVTFLEGQTVTVTNSLTINGAAGQLLLLRGANSGAAVWSIAVPATQSISYVNVAYSTATGNTAAAGVTSTDSGNNTNWTFGIVSPTSRSLTLLGVG